MNYAAETIAKATKRTDRAVEMINAGFTSKAQQKRATDELSRAYKYVRDLANHAAMDAAMVKAGRGTEQYDEQVYWDIMADWEVPFDLHNYREAKHADMVNALISDDLGGTCNDYMLNLVDLRELAKATPIAKPEKTEAQKVEALAADFQAEAATYMQRVKAHCVRGLNLAEVFGGLCVTADVRYCMNQHGTHYTQIFYKVDGKITPFKVVCVLSEALKDETVKQKLIKYLERF